MADPAADSKAYQAAVEALASACENLLGSDGWQIFLALFHRRKQEIYSRDDYETLADFKGDRKAIEIVEGIIEDMRTFKEDGEAQREYLAHLNDADPTPRGIMLIEAVDGDNEAGAL